MTAPNPYLASIEADCARLRAEVLADRARLRGEVQVTAIPYGDDWQAVLATTTVPWEKAVRLPVGQCFGPGEVF